MLDQGTNSKMLFWCYLEVLHVFAVEVEVVVTIYVFARARSTKRTPHPRVLDHFLAWVDESSRC